MPLDNRDKTWYYRYIGRDPDSFSPLSTMLLAVNSFQIDTNPNGDRYARIEADVEILRKTYYAEPMFVPTACVASVLLSDDDANDYSRTEEQIELAEDVTNWEVDTTQYV